MKRAILNGAVALFATVVALLIVEGAFRLLKPSGSRPWSDRPYAYFMREGAQSLQGVPVSTKASGIFRVDVVGDSFTFGPHLHLEDTFPKRLERWLNLNDSAPTVEVINRGVSGFSTFDEVPLVQRSLDQRSDLVILQITLNDAVLDALNKETHAELFGSAFLNKPIFKIWSSLGYVANRLHATSSYNKYLEYHRKPFSDQDTGARFKNSISKMAETAKSRDVPFVAVIFPLFDFPFDSSYPFNDLHELIGSVLIDNGIRYLDLQRAYRGIPHERLQIIPGSDSHPNEIANRIAAERILAFLGTEQLVPDTALPKRVFLSRKDIKSRRGDPHRVWNRGMRRFKATRKKDAALKDADLNESDLGYSEELAEEE